MIWVHVALVVWSAAIARAAWRRSVDWLTRPRQEATR